MTRAIEAIPTEYKGQAYRSRTEARWAVFLEEIGLRFIYEPRRYELSNGESYLPDFWIPELRTFLEVKPENEGIRIAERARIECFAKDRNDRTLRFWISRGSPSPLSEDYLETINPEGEGWHRATLAEDMDAPGCFFLFIATAAHTFSRGKIYIGGPGTRAATSYPMLTKRIRNAMEEADRAFRPVKPAQFAKLDQVTSRWPSGRGEAMEG